jgi:hypothetical protein
MHKHIGKQACRQTLYQLTIDVDKTKAANPTSEVLQRIEAQKQLKFDVDHETSGLSTISIKPTNKLG